MKAERQRVEPGQNQTQCRSDVGGSDTHSAGMSLEELFKIIFWAFVQI